VNDTEEVQVSGVKSTYDSGMAVGESAARWLRVSTGDQDEANQVPDVDGWCRDHGYVVRKTCTLRGKSASKGQQDKALDDMIEDMRRGVFTVLVVWASDRIERRGAYSAFDLARRVKQAGGRIEYVKDAYLNEANDMSDVMLAMAATKDRLESKRKTERTTMVQSRIRQAGAFVGKPPFGYKVAGEKYARQLVPTDKGRLLIPEIYDRCIKGQSLATIGAWLEEETGLQWWPRRVSGTLRNPVYRGVQEDDEGRPIHRCEALVDAAIWKRANDALHKHGKRGPESKQPALLSGVLFCGNPDCHDAPDSPMYRHKGTRSGEYYRCAGKGTQRKGCGNMVRLVTLDGLVDMCMKAHGKGLAIKDWFIEPGTDHQAEVEEVRFEIRSVMMSDMPDDAIDKKVAELRAERDRLLALPTVPDRLVERPTGETYAGKWRRLNTQERGAWLRERGLKVRAYKGDNGFHVVILSAQGQELIEYRSPEPVVVEE
jgi:DNA invertase Pin-like site-specific DNA recombinase